MQVSTTFPDSTYTSSNLPSADTLKADIAALETAHNDTDTKSVKTTDVSLVGASFFLDEDAMTSNSAVKVSSQQAIKAYVDAAITSTLGAIYPVGSTFISGSATMPAAVAALGTWERLQGVVIVGASDTDGDFDNGDTGGAKTHALSIAELAAHNHGGATGGQSANHTHTVQTRDGDGTPTGYADLGKIDANGDSFQTGNASNDHTHGITSQGSGTAHNNLQPYKAKYMWERTA